MAKKKDEKDVLVVRDEKTGEISVVAGLNADGTPKRTSGPSETLTAKRTITPKISGTGRSRHTDGLPTAYGQ